MEEGSQELDLEITSQELPSLGSTSQESPPSNPFAVTERSVVRSCHLMYWLPFVPPLASDHILTAGIYLNNKSTHLLTVTIGYALPGAFPEGVNGGNIFLRSEEV